MSFNLRRSQLAISTGLVAFAFIAISVCEAQVFHSSSQRDSHKSFDESETTFSLYPIRSRSCGAYCLLAFFRLHEVAISAEQCLDLVPVSEQGTSLAELAAASNRIGFDAAVFSGTISELESQQFKGVVVLLHESESLKSLEEKIPREKIIGHYVTLLGTETSTGRIVAIDGTYGDIRRFSRDRFTDIWSGYYMAPKHVSHAPWSTSVSVQIILSAIAFLGVFESIRYCLIACKRIWVN